MSKRNEQQVLSEIQKVQGHYHDNVKSLSAVQVRNTNDKLKELREELSSLFTVGARKCPKDGSKPHGMRKNPSTVEVGCLVCENRSRGVTVEEAVAKWNKGEFVK